MIKAVVILSIVLIGSNYAHADLPLTVENLLSDKGKTRLEFSTTYVNSERRGVDSADPIIVQTGPATFVEIPSLVGERFK